jgi:DnaK suppressor protein
MDDHTRRNGFRKSNNAAAQPGANGQPRKNGQAGHNGQAGQNGQRRSAELRAPARLSEASAASHAAPSRARRMAAPPSPSPELSETTVPPSSLSARDVDRYRAMLLTLREQLLGAVQNMENEALGKSRSESAGDLSLMPIHMADIGTDNYEQEFTLGLVASERETLKEIDEALARIEAGTYGVCLGTHKPISRARLDARPWAKYCIEYHRQQEQRGRSA